MSDSKNSKRPLVQFGLFSIIAWNGFIGIMTQTFPQVSDDGLNIEILIKAGAYLFMLLAGLYVLRQIYIKNEF